MNRYFISFLIAICFYSFLIALYIFSKDIKKVHSVVTPKVTQRITFRIQKEVKPKPIVKPKPKPKPIVKPKPKPKKKEKPKPKLKPKPVKKPIVKRKVIIKKKVIKPKPKPKIKPKPKYTKIKKIIKPKPKPIEKPIKQKIVKKPAIKEQIVPPKIIQKPKPKKNINTKELKRKQALFLENMKNRINENKYYPKRAKRREIEGSVDVKFILLENGEMQNITILNGKKIFHNSVEQAIKDSFPIQIKKDLFKFPLPITLKIVFVLE